jgi:uncharacterized RDD family membrane protein YckC
MDEKFRMTVSSVMDSSGDFMVAGVLQSGQQPQRGDKVRVIRTGKVGTIADSTSLGEALGHAMQSGADVTVIGSGRTLATRVALRILDLGVDDVQSGDEIAACCQEPRESAENQSVSRVTAEQVWRLVSPSNLRHLDASERIVELGEEAVPSVIDVFVNPINRYGERGVASQAQLAAALVQFAEQRNQQAANFLRDVAKGRYPLHDPFEGRIALNHAKRFASRTVHTEKPQEAVAVTQPVKVTIPTNAKLPTGPTKVEVQPDREKVAYASFWQRTLAFLIDLFLVCIPPILLALPAQTTDANDARPIQLLLGFLIIVWAYSGPLVVFALPLRLWNGQTLGKRLLGIMVIGERGGKPTWGQSVGRTLSYLVSCFSVLGFFWCIGDEQKRCLHDIIAHTRVVKKVQAGGK